MNKKNVYMGIIGILEFWLPLLIIILMAVFLIFTDEINNYISMNFLKELLSYLNEEISNLSGVIATIATVFCAIVLTSLSVFGSTVSHSIVILSKDDNAVKKFILYACCSLIGSAVLFIISLISSFINLKFYIWIFIFTFCSIWAYTCFSIFMFYSNIVNVKEEKQSNESLLGEVRAIKIDLRALKDTIDDYNKNKK